MTQTPPPTQPGAVHKSTAAATSARLIRTARRAALATLDQATGHPYASLVTVAVDADGAPLMLLSRLARHTHNLDQDARASLLFEEAAVDGREAAAGDLLAGARVTVLGLARPTLSVTARDRFLARHPEAQMYAGFTDFAYVAMAVTGAHFIGGFGRIVDVGSEELLHELRVAG